MASSWWNVSALSKPFQTDVQHSVDDTPSTVLWTLMSLITVISIKIVQPKKKTQISYHTFSTLVFTTTGFVPVGFQSNATAYAFKASKGTDGLVAFLLKMLNGFMYWKLTDIICNINKFMLICVKMKYCVRKDVIMKPLSFLVSYTTCWFYYLYHICTL